MELTRETRLFFLRLFFRSFAVMNLSHIIHEWSFGPYYPKIAQPLDMSMEISDKCTFQPQLTSTSALVSSLPFLLPFSSLRS